MFYSWKLKNKIKIKHFKLWSNIYQKWCSWNVCLFWFFFVGNLFLKFTNYKKMSWNHVNNDRQLQFFTFNIFTFKKISVTLMKFYRALTMVFTKTTQMHTFFNRFFFRFFTFVIIKLCTFLTLFTLFKCKLKTSNITWIIKKWRSMQIVGTTFLCNAKFALIKFWRL